MKGTTNFLCFDFESPAILKQLDGWNCGLACVANAVAFVYHFETTEFVLSGMKLVADDTNEICYIVDKETYNLRLFWEGVERKASQQNKWFTTTNILWTA